MFRLALGGMTGVIPRWVRVSTHYQLGTASSRCPTAGLTGVMAITKCLIWVRSVNRLTAPPRVVSHTGQRVCPNNGKRITGEDHEQDEQHPRTENGVDGRYAAA